MQSSWRPISISLVIAFTFLPALGQSSQGQSKLWGSSTTHHLHQNINPIKVAPDLPDMPAYSGQTKFLRGYIQTSDKDTTVYQVSYMTKDDPVRVKQWFDYALPSRKWKIISSGERNIAAKHQDGHFCSIMVNDATDPEYKGLLTVSYRQVMSPQ
jgi:hypothetical protein